MSKYIYSTVYEQFTGLKPPEPKSHKPRRRRGYGHPYRMRLNMQESEHEEGEEGEEGFEDSYQEEFTLENEPREISKPAPSPKPIYEARANLRNAFEDDHSSKLPKVTYKKRRQYEPELRTE
ncbi:MAG: hypothetical protein ACR2PT_16585 [Endozoicomonas sp.]